MMSFNRSSSFDAFAKPIDGIRTKTSLGGGITVLAASTAIFLFLSQIFLYWKVDVQHTLDLAPSFPLSVVIPTEGGFSKSLHAFSPPTSSSSSSGYKKNKHKKKNQKEIRESIRRLAFNKLDVFVHITFPKLNCKVLDYSQNGATFSSGDFIKNNAYSKFVKTRPTEYDYAVATGQSTLGKSKKRRDSSPQSEDSCTIRGTITVPRIGGDLAFFMSETAFKKTAEMVQMGRSLEEADESTGGHNVSHYIHEITFGNHFPLSVHPLKDTEVTMKDDSGIGLHQLSIRLIPTKYTRFFRPTAHTYQISTSSYHIKPELLILTRPMKLPGLNVHYDFNPVQVHHEETRENFFVFLSSLVGIVGGVFVTVGLVSALLVNSAKVVIGKKHD